MCDMTPIRAIRIIDSHTEGEPTRVVVDGGPALGSGPLGERLRRFRDHFDHFRSGIVCEPRGSEVVVGALLVEPEAADATAGVIFFNDVGYLGMCGHGTIGVITTLAHLGRIEPGEHRIETPVGTVTTRLHDDGSVTVTNVPSRRARAGQAVEVPGYGTVVGDIAWGGNWFFLVAEHPFPLELKVRADLVQFTTAIRQALREGQITGDDGQDIDHIELFSPSSDPANAARNFVLCPGASFDRSPCGTGTSAKMACLYADGKLRPGEIWHQEGILGTVFHGSYTEGQGGFIHPSVRGRAWITAEATLHFAPDDPFANGVRFS